jgi:hypothetical protein
MPSNFTKPSPVTPTPERVISKVWITKYALTKGVYTAENVEHSHSSDRIIRVDYTDAYGLGAHFWVAKPHWHTTEDEARAEVQKMVNAALKSLKKKRDKLDKIMASVAGTVPSKPWT